ncbi:MAG TPA: TetR/AcrR family transcriptional regulator [Tissierellaceae bacterium]
MTSIYDKKEDVFQVAIALAKEKGLSNLTIRDLAEVSGVSIGSVYNLFGTKEKLVMSLMEDYWIRSVETLKEENLDFEGNCIEKLENLYKSLGIVAMEFHKDFIKDIVGVNMSNEAISTFNKKYKKIMQDHIQLILLEDEDASKAFDDELTAEELSRYLVDRFLIMLREHEKDLGFTKVILKRLLNI